MEEILNLTRDYSISQSSKRKSKHRVSPKILEEILYNMDRLLQEVEMMGAIELVKPLERFLRIFDKLIEELSFSADMPNSLRKVMMYRYEDIKMRLIHLRHMTMKIERPKLIQDDDESEKK